MYLEQRIEALEGQVDKLIKLVEELMTTPATIATPKAAIVSEVMADVEFSAKPIPKPTAKSLQDRCLALVRKDPANKDKIKDALAAFNVKLLKDLTDAQLVEMEEVIANLENA